MFKIKMDGILGAEKEVSNVTSRVINNYQCCLRGLK